MSSDFPSRTPHAAIFHPIPFGRDRRRKPSFRDRHRWHRSEDRDTASSNCRSTRSSGPSPSIILIIRDELKGVSAMNLTKSTPACFRSSISPRCFSWSRANKGAFLVRVFRFRTTHNSTRASRCWIGMGPKRTTMIRGFPSTALSRHWVGLRTHSSPSDFGSNRPETSHKR